MLAAIAKERLHLETLSTRNSDRLDFSEQAVWSLEGALRAANEAGVAARGAHVHVATGSRALN